MKLLLDTHTFLWFIDDSPRLSARAKSLLESDADLLLSVASLWEISIKISIGKLTLAQPFDVFLRQQLTNNDIEILPISLAHLGVVSTLPFHHRDPFDRLLIAQEIIEKMSVVGIDTAFDAYSITRLW
ncbi:MAG TPA: type II toxin-antitoxin system VapC family toxin [Pyrinomonadaceae bacterium]|jgi:PIN domain nuclease of toxin-antitoxin system|nr:type II toxin-antitoxin system VapC family toxin [Pyrinomonadaceae bacterium]